MNPRRLPSVGWLGHCSFLALCCFLPLALAAYLPAHGWFDRSGQLIGRDFVNLWTAAQLLAEGHIAQAFHIDSYTTALQRLFGTGFPFHNWSYPPSILPLITVFSGMPYPLALAVWTVLGLTAFLVAARPKNTKARWPYYLLLALSPAAVMNLLSGQNGFFTAALFIGGFQCLHRRPVLAGILFGLLTLKPHLGLLVPFALLLLGQWRAIAAATTTAALLIVTSLLLWGPALWQAYFSEVLAYQQQLLLHFEGFYTYLMPSAFAGMKLLGASHSAAVSIHVITACIAAAAALSIVAREGASPRALLALALATPLALPYSYHYDLTTMSAALLLYLAAHPVQGRARLLWAAVWATPAVLPLLSALALPLVPPCLLGALGWLTYRSARPDAYVRILPFHPSRAPYFDRFNRAWISKFFWIEPFDEELLTDPQRIIIDAGGEVWFAAIDGNIVGTCALLASGDGMFEFSKLGLSDDAKGRGISRLLLHHCIARARRRGAHTLRIFTHSSLATACAIYRSEGFADIPMSAEEKARYARGDTLLLLRL